MKKLVNSSFFYAILALCGGVFYREFTRLNGFEGKTALAVVHTHLFMLGMFFFLIAALLEHGFRLTGDKRFGWFLALYHSGLFIAVAALIWRGTAQVLSLPLSRGLDASISGVAGLGHILLGAGLILFFIILRGRLKNQSA